VPPDRPGHQLHKRFLSFFFYDFFNCKSRDNVFSLIINHSLTKVHVQAICDFGMIRAERLGRRQVFTRSHALWSDKNGKKDQIVLKLGKKSPLHAVKNGNKIMSKIACSNGKRVAIKSSKDTISAYKHAT